MLTIDTGMTFVQENPMLPIYIVCAYMGFCYFGPMYMSWRPAFDLRVPLSRWNLGLSIFSFFGAVFTIPCLWDVDDLCVEPDFDGMCGWWVQLFIFSKIPELLDTFFIVARKKPLLFLHWYHHATVLLFCWYSYAYKASTGIYFVTMNYSVHSIMYGYYYLMAVDAKPFWLNPMFITVCQISQMIVGTVLSAVSFYRKIMEPDDCAIKTVNIVAGFLMYGSYLYLFVDFALKKIETRSNKVHVG
jgi:elongation of very long chain fatty acids protein 6